MSMFCDADLAARIERAEAELMEATSRAAGRRRGDGSAFALALAGGAATFAETDSPFNKIAGLGFGGTPPDAELERVERAFEAAGSPVQAEVATLADPAIAELLTGRGYRLVSFENVLGRSLTDLPETGPAAGIEVRPSGEDPYESLVADATATADTQGVPSHEDFDREVLVNAMRDLAESGARRWLALRDGEPAGGGSMRIAGTIAQLTGAATSPAHRRRGVQTALLAARLAEAAVAGCEVAVVTTQPGSQSQQNVQRMGFDLLYTRAVLLRQA
ncbi:GNAT family N-acetyltransferase [Actinoplanes sp. NBRC 103695]|uniref:GNAT family N-acetyltransferase n=1 Tax=Actinoplanes sp. NBRC 103695 TaxID=3032202 RepID=UPI0024A04F21|nr:GNAT family N-acetyltransferase [Actinoplanes sp. NBRC 103695]GLY93199.1 GNAT family acetyltransferase [Actinoplanes sp. NBRC 103695]